jgi:hypothetical protein
MWRKLAMAVLLPVTALVLMPSGAQADTRAELCSAPEVYGSYALRACIEYNNGAHVYAYVSLKAGHSPCEIRLRWVRSDGAAGPIHTQDCPLGEYEHYRVDHPYSVGPGTFQAAASIRRLSDDHIEPKAQSPFLTVG